MLLRKQLQRPQPVWQRSVAPLVWPSRRAVPFPARLLHGSRSSRNDDNGGNNFRHQDDAATASDQEAPQSQDSAPRPPPELQEQKRRLSLWDELFPGESNRVFRSQLEVEAEPPRLPPHVFDIPDDFQQDLLEQWTETDETSFVDGPRRPGGMLILSAASKHLEESDFMRLGVQGRHVEGWVSGIIKGETAHCCFLFLFPFSMCANIANPSSSNSGPRPRNP